MAAYTLGMQLDWTLGVLRLDLEHISDLESKRQDEIVLTYLKKLGWTGSSGRYLNFIQHADIDSAVLT